MGDTICLITLIGFIVELGDIDGAFIPLTTVTTILIPPH
jgi:hypothetical protein